MKKGKWGLIFAILIILALVFVACENVDSSVVSDAITLSTLKTELGEAFEQLSFADDLVLDNERREICFSVANETAEINVSEIKTNSSTIAVSSDDGSSLSILVLNEGENLFSLRATSGDLTARYVLKITRNQSLTPPKESGQPDDTTDPIFTPEAQHTHTFSEFWSFDSTHHWHAANCGHDEIADKTTHNWSDGVISKAATETDEGVMTFNCTVCDAVRTEVIEIVSHTHDWGEWESYLSATCVSRGTERRYCISCGECESRMTEVDPCAHDLVRHNGQAATCINKGWNTYETCSRCSYSTFVEIEALGHDYQEAVTAPTCTERGYTTFTCSRCDDSYVGNYVDAKNHTEVIDPAVPATCVTTGLTAGMHCSECEIILIPQWIVEKDADNHVFDEWIIEQPPTCTQTGLQYRRCNGCGKNETTNIPATGHSGEWVILQQATCLHKGKKEINCSTCDKTIREEIEITDHAWCDWIVTKEPSCGIGSKERICSTCGKEQKEILEAISQMNHAFDDKNVCTTCGEHRATVGLKYEMDNANYRGLCVVGYEGTETSVYIPYYYAGQKVETIKEKAFAKHSEITSIFIPESVRRIENNAFEDCSGLTSIEIPKSVESMGACLSGCMSLQDLTVPFVGIHYTSTSYVDRKELARLFGQDSSGMYQYKLEKVTVTRDNVGDEAFFGCSKIKEIIIEPGVQKIGISAFRNCSELENIVLPNSITTIGESAFYNCKSLVSISLPDGVTSIGNYAFSYCEKLISISIPSRIEKMGCWFCGCTSLEKIDIPFIHSRFGSLFGSRPSSGYEGGITISQDVDGLSTSGSIYYSYYVPDSIREVVIRGGTIPRAAFYNFTMLTSITIGDDVTSIGESAFQSCADLKDVLIGNGVTSIGESAFQSCADLKDVLIGNGVKSIDDFAFYYCSSLTQITIPQGVTSIGSSAFSYCRKLTSIIYLGTMVEWERIAKGEEWDKGTGAYTGSYTICCTDGVIERLTNYY